jgi:DNA helicase-2/ATP-dependent DNA helicase PcrA
MNYLESLSDPQKAAVTSIDGPLLIVAGAGAGKTKTLTARIAYIIEQGTNPASILAVTFTNKAAREMRERVASLLAHKKLHSMPVVSTFHSLGVMILRDFGHKLNLKRGFAVLDDADTLTLIKECLRELDISPKEHDPKMFRSVIAKEKEKGKVYTDMSAHNHNSEMIKNVWRLYEEKKEKSGGVDFTDLISLPIKLLRENNDICEHYKKRFTHIHVDEYQDVNDQQVELIQLLLGEHNNICVVGDADQTIYTWRGASVHHILSFEKKFSPCHVILLEENYRSTPVILGAANNVVSKNQERVPKNLYTNKIGGEKITILECVDEYDEARFVLKNVQELMNSGIDVNNIAILYRANYQSRVLEEAFLGAGVPYIMLGTKFLDRREVKDLVAFIRLSINQNSIPDLVRAIGAVSCGIGKTTLAKILTDGKNSLTGKTAILAQNFFNKIEKIYLEVNSKKPSEALVFAIKHSGLEDEIKKEGEAGVERLENIKELVSLASNYDGYGADGMDLFLEHISLYDADRSDNKTEGVRLMTVHSAKGLEWDYVFITGLEQDLFPHARDELASKAENEEERRLMYVALTRAKKKLYLSYAQLRTIFGQKRVETPSEFLYDIDESDKEVIQSWAGNLYGTDRVVYLD